MFEAIEQLENRQLYSTSSLSSGVLTVTGTSGVDHIYVSQAPIRSTARTASTTSASTF